MTSDTGGGVNTKYNLPKDSKKHLGEYIVFYSDEKNPKVLFSSIDPEEAQKEADKINKETNRIPTVVRVTEDRNDASHLLLHGV